MSVFDKANRAAMPVLPSLLAKWLPGGQCIGDEYVVRNPTRIDARPGSFLINIKTGKWADFATGDKGRDVVSLFAYLSNTSQFASARAILGMLR